MKNTKRILCAVLAMVMLLSVMLTGCDRPKLTINKIPPVAATYGDGQELTSGQYLAYLYLNFESIYPEAYNYVNQYAAYLGTTTDPWAEKFPYGDSEELLLSDYIIRATQDSIKNQIVLAQMMKDYGIQWDAEDLAELNKLYLDGLEKDFFIDLGFNNDSYAFALKNLNLNERSVFFGLYGEGGKRAIAKDELTKYFEDNYLSVKMFSIPLTDSNGKELDKEGKAYQDLMGLMNGYMETYKKEGFDAAYEQYEKDQTKISDIRKAAASTTTTTTGTTGTGTGSDATATGSTTTTAAPTTTTTAAPTTTTAASTTTTGTGSTAATEKEEEEHHHEHRQDVDSTTIDEALKDVIVGKKDKDGKVEIEAIEVGDCKIVEYKSGGSTPTVALIERLDIHKDDEGKEGAVYEAAEEDIIVTLKYEEFTAEVEKLVSELKIKFDKKVVAACKPEDFMEILENQ